MELSNQINHFVNKLSRRELLLGECENEDVLTSTQEHILMLLATNNQITNTKLAEELSISAAAVTKAVKVLQERGFVKSYRSKQDERVIELFLSETGKPIAKEHATHHQRTMETYQEFLKEFSADEQLMISKFLHKLEEVIG